MSQLFLNCFFCTKIPNDSKETIKLKKDVLNETKQKMSKMYQSKFKVII